MNAATLLTGLYPPAVRERWGEDIRHEVSASGFRSWPDTLAGAARLWLRPGDWPETSTGQTRRVLTVALFALAAATGLLLRSAEPSTTLTADLRHPATSLWLVPLLLGIGLGAPLPPPAGESLRRLAAAAVRTLAAPAAAVVAMCLLAWSDVAQHLTGFADAAAVVYYWLTLGFVAFRLCVLVARVARTAALPTTRRLSTALLHIGTGLALAASQNLLALARTGLRPESLAETLTLGLLAATAFSTGRDLRRKRA
ncbi:hypothetical protein RKE30_02905 [Streptomyces sp. Li-HN-5-11]|uniref:hypothetical protein n=1 Tax=Streptomyces sp. Li-HN-5-11 TaxID=3075432 RepID=UPI0028B1E740|nr:hypothetical protein [Streptomyces sp. Li-HN-5-11]WNM29416.1 hypothetical protein RKE30_02905 [Streptomyces sp. Li-HN-5-11]